MSMRVYVITRVSENPHNSCPDPECCGIPEPKWGVVAVYPSEKAARAEQCRLGREVPEWEYSVEEASFISCREGEG